MGYNTAVNQGVSASCKHNEKLNSPHTGYDPGAFWSAANSAPETMTTRRQWETVQRTERKKKNWEQRNSSKDMLQKWKKRVSLWPVTLTIWEAPSGLIMWKCMSVCMSWRVRPAVSPTVCDTGFSLIDKCPTPSLLSVKPESVSHREFL